MLVLGKQRTIKYSFSLTSISLSFREREDQKAGLHLDKSYETGKYRGRMPQSWEARTVFTETSLISDLKNEQESHRQGQERPEE